MIEVSIITVNLNNAAGLKKTVESVMNQVFRNFEYIVVDGASTDGSIEAIKEYTSRIDHLVSEPDQGIYHAMNKGIGMANGRYCLFLNSGDWLADDQVLSNVFEKEQDADIISGDTAYYDPAKQTVKWLIPSPDDLTANTFFNGTLPHQSTFIKRELFLKYGLYSEELIIASDWLFFVETFLERNATYSHYTGLVSYFNLDGFSYRNENKNLPKEEQLAVLRTKYPRFIADYNRLKQLHEENIGWTGSREFRVYQFLKHAGIISLGVFMIRGFNYFRRKTKTGLSKV